MLLLIDLSHSLPKPEEREAGLGWTKENARPGRKGMADVRTRNKSEKARLPSAVRFDTTTAPLKEEAAAWRPFFTFFRL